MHQMQTATPGKQAPVVAPVVLKPAKEQAPVRANEPAPKPTRTTRFVLPWNDELTDLEAPRLLSLVARRIDRSGCDVTVDLSECPHLDEDGAQALLALRDFAIRRGHALRVVTAPGTRPAAKLTTYRIGCLFE